jgi:DNA mismatch repair protein MutS
VRAFTLFATHYFELTVLPEQIPGVANVHLDATEHAHELVFLHAVKEGPADRSYGLQVAALAGIPKLVIAQAKGYLAQLESTQRQPKDKAPNQQQIGLFTVDPDKLSPKEALELLYQLKKMAEEP